MSENADSWQSDPYAILFPLDIAYKPSLLWHANHLSVPASLHSGVWRQLLIVFPGSTKQTLKADEWLDILKQSRDLYLYRLSAFPVSLVALRSRQDQWREAVRTLSVIFSETSQNLTSETLDTLLRIISFIISHNSSIEFVHSTAFVVGHLYNEMMTEALVKADESPRAILFDKSFVFHDVYSCAKQIMNLLSPIFDTEHLKGELWRAGISEFNLSTILEIYGELFNRYVAGSDWHAVLTFIFAKDCGSSVFHNLYKQMASSEWRDIIEVLKTYGEAKESVSEDRVTKLSHVFDELIDVMRDEPDGKIETERRRVVMYQISQIIRVLRTSGLPDELTPARELLSVLT